MGFFGGIINKVIEQVKAAEAAAAAERSAQSAKQMIIAQNAQMQVESDAKAAEYQKSLQDADAAEADRRAKLGELTKKSKVANEARKPLSMAEIDKARTELGQTGYMSKL